MRRPSARQQATSSGGTENAKRKKPIERGVVCDSTETVLGEMRAVPQRTGASKIRNSPRRDSARASKWVFIQRSSSSQACTTTGVRAGSAEREKLKIENEDNHSLLNFSFSILNSEGRPALVGEDSRR